MPTTVDRFVLSPPWLWRAVAVVGVVGCAVVVGQRWGTGNAAVMVPVAGLAGGVWLLGALELPVPEPVFVGVILATTFVLVMDPAFNQDDLAPFQLVILVAGAAALLRPRWSVAMLAVSIAILFIGALTGEFGGAGIWSLGLAMGWFGGYSIRAQAQADAASRRRAVAEERAHIARELHDVVAHSLAVTMLHLTGARLALRRDPDEAEAALWQAEESGRQSMADIRRAVGLLGASGASAPMPGAGDIAELVHEFAAAGLPVDLRVEGDPAAVSPAAGLALYRIAQESMANVVKHAPDAAAEVTLLIDRDSACLSVRNPLDGDVPTRHDGGPSDGGPSDGGPNDGGLGIDGMRERITHVGGTLRAGPDDGSTWCVVAETPVGTEA